MMARMQMLEVQIDRFICPAMYGLNVFPAPGNVGELEPVELGMPDVLNLPPKELQEGESLTDELPALCGDETSCQFCVENKEHNKHKTCPQRRLLHACSWAQQGHWPG